MRTIQDALEPKYKQIEFGKHPTYDADSASYKKEDDVLSKEIHLLEETAGLS